MVFGRSGMTVVEIAILFAAITYAKDFVDQEPFTGLDYVQVIVLAVIIRYWAGPFVPR